MEVVQGSVIPEGRETVHGGLGVMERGSSELQQLRF